MDRVLTVKQAAEALQVSADTIRRRIKAGELKAEKVPGAYGLQWVIKESDLAESAEIVEVVPVHQSLTARDLEQLLRHVTQEQTDEIKALREEVKQLRAELHEQKLLTTKEGPGKRWWRFWQTTKSE